MNSTLININLLNILCVNVEFDFLFEVIEGAGFPLFSDEELNNWQDNNKIFIKKLVQHFSDALNAKLTYDHSEYNLVYTNEWDQRFHIKSGIINPQYVLTFEYNPNLINQIYSPEPSGLNDKLIVAFGEYEFNKAFQRILKEEVETLTEAGLRINVYTNMSGCSFWIKVSLIQENLEELEVFKRYEELKEKIKVLRELEIMEEFVRNIDDDNECVIGDEDEDDEE